MNHFSLSSLFICFPVLRMVVVTPSSIPCRYSTDTSQILYSVQIL